MTISAWNDVNNINKLTTFLAEAKNIDGGLRKNGSFRGRRFFYKKNDTSVSVSIKRLVHRCEKLAEKTKDAIEKILIIKALFKLAGHEIKSTAEDILHLRITRFFNSSEKRYKRLSNILLKALDRPSNNDTLQQVEQAVLRKIKKAILPLEKMREDLTQALPNSEFKFFVFNRLQYLQDPFDEDDKKQAANLLNIFRTVAPPNEARKQQLNTLISTFIKTQLATYILAPG